jgi:hypothetical protein
MRGPVAFRQPCARVRQGELVDRYGVHDIGMRRLLVEYLTERETTCDYTTLTSAAFHLAKLFWVDLEAHEPGLRSLAGTVNFWCNS